MGIHKQSYQEMIPNQKSQVQKDVYQAFEAIYHTVGNITRPSRNMPKQKHMEKRNIKTSDNIINLYWDKK